MSRRRRRRGERPARAIPTPGVGAGYAGEGYECLARFASAKLARPFEEVVKETVLAPLAMTDTTMTRTDWTDGRVVVSRFADCARQSAQVRKDASVADDLTTAAHDYAPFLAAAMADEGV